MYSIVSACLEKRFVGDESVAVYLNTVASSVVGFVEI